MFVYLDTSCLSAFDDAIRRDPANSNRFLTRWEQLGCQLVLSRYHIQEIVQLGVPASIQNRLTAIGRFPIIRFAAAATTNVVVFELSRQLFAHVTGGRASYGDIRGSLFPISDIASVAEYLHANRARFETKSAIETVNATFETGLLTQIRNAAPSVLKKRRAEVLSPEFDAYADARNLAAGVKDPVERKAMEVNLVRLSEATASTQSHRQAVIKFLELDSIRAIDKVPDVDLPLFAVYLGRLVERAMGVMVAMGYTGNEIIRGIQSIEPYDAPGLSLHLARERAMKTSGQTIERSDYIDTDHATFAPHVDVAFVDRNTYGQIMSEHRDRGELLPGFAEWRIRRFRDLLQVEAELEGLAGA